MKLKLKNIRIDCGTQARLKMDRKKVAEYAAIMQDGIPMPPVDVHTDGKEYWLSNGFHRYFAAKQIGLLEMDCEIHQGSLDDAILFSLTANGKNGLAMTHDDNVSMVSRLLAHPKWKNWTDVQIAKHLHISNSTVGRIRRKLEEKGEVEKKSEKKYKNKHGKESTMNVENIGKKSKEVPKNLPKAPEPESSHDFLKELTDTISSLSEENTTLKDKIAIGQWDASEIEKIDATETIANLRSQIKQLEAENKSLIESRDMYMNRNAELTKTVKALQAKLKKMEAVDA